jgi:oxygen-independent coproporphyrinogen-3 oxidase
MLMMGLRLTEGVSLDRVVGETGHPLDHWIASARLQRLIDGGMLMQTGQVLSATEDGRVRLDSVLAALL